MIGTLINCAAIILGSAVGLLFRKSMNKKVSDTVMQGVGLCVILIGLSGAFSVSSAHTLSTSITNDVGWTGIIVAWLSQLHTGVIFAVAALICVLHTGSVEAAASFSRVDSSFANMLQGAILFLILAADFFIRFRVVITKKGGSKNG